MNFIPKHYINLSLLQLKIYINCSSLLVIQQQIFIYVGLLSITSHKMRYLIKKNVIDILSNGIHLIIFL